MSTTIRSNNLLDQIRDRIDRGQVSEALEMINRSSQHSPPMENARAVCMMRLGKIDQAVIILRELVFPRGSVCVAVDTPTVYQTNYVTAMLLSGNVFGATGVLSGIHDREHPAVMKLKTAIRKWKKGLGLFRRILCVFGAYPSRPVPLDFPPGDL